MSEFRAKISEKVFRERVDAFESTIGQLNPSRISKFDVRKILSCLTLISGSAERSIKEYIAMGSDDEVNKLYTGTVSVFESVLPFLPDPALKEAKLNQQRFERRVASFARIHQLKESYADLKSSFRIRKKDE